MFQNKQKNCLMLSLSTMECMKLHFPEVKIQLYMSLKGNYDELKRQKSNGTNTSTTRSRRVRLISETSLSYRANLLFLMK